MVAFRKSLALLPVLALAFTVLQPSAHAQTVTGSITGTVVDPGGAVVVGANVELTNQVTKQVRQFSTSSNGTFIFPDLVPSDYDIKVAQTGFKAYVLSGISVGTLEKVDLHTIPLQVGDVTTSIEVQGEAARVATDSADHSNDVNLKQIQETPIRGRNFQAIIKDLPGVIDTGTYDSRGWNTNSAVINGGQQGQVLITFDGIAAQDSGAPGLSTYQAPSLDAVAEVRLLTGNYNAEYGARNGGQMNITIKNGTPQFHGSTYYYYRHEEFNANEWFNNQLGVAKPRYRYENPGVTIGGPVLLPFVNFNRSRNKLFFFASWDQIWNKQVTGLNKFTVPTALERQGDFSQTFLTDGKTPILIRDPSTGQTCSATNMAGCFPGNKVPASRINAIGAAMLNLFPLPNTTDPTGNHQYNFTDVLSNLQPRRDVIVRGDYNIGTKDTAFFRYLQDYQANTGYGAILGAAGDAWGQFPHSYFIPSQGFAGTWIHTFRNNLINEFTAGQNRAHQQNQQTDDALYGNSLLPLKSNGQQLTLPTIFASANTLNLLPNVNFGLPSGFSAASAPSTLPNLPGFGFDSRWPFDGTDYLMTITDNVSWIKGPHSFKAGMYFEHDHRDVSVYSVYNTAGTYYFGSDLGNPADTGFAFSNALTGNLYGYGQDNIKQINHASYNQIEGFVQDSWKVNRRLTLELGVRIQYLGPLYEASGSTQGIFLSSAYDSNAQGQLLFPTCTVALTPNAGCPTNSKASINPRTGTTYPYAQQGTFSPGSTAGLNNTPFSGIVQQATGSADYFKAPPVQFSPRVGFAYDPFGNGKTAIRGGFGIFYGRAFGIDTLGATGVGIGPLATPTHFLAPIILNTNISQLSGSSLVFTPQTTVGGPLDYLPPGTYDWTFAVQRDVGKGFVLDVSYVGNVAHHQFNQGNIDLNAVKPLTTWTPTANNGQPGPVARFLDPTSGNGGTGAFYSTNLIRALASPFPGWGGIQQYTQNGESLYDALQAQLNKRVGQRLHFGVNFTWSKTLVYSRQQWVNDYLNKTIPAAARPEALNVTFGYAAPSLSRFLGHSKPVEYVTGGWHLDGIMTFYRGQALGVGCSANGAPIGYWTGTPTGGIPFRCNINGDVLTQQDQLPTKYFLNTAAFSLPSVTSLGIGNAPPILFYGPGIENVDLSLYKDIHLGSERNALTLKFETFNTLNHFNPANPNTTLALNCGAVNGVCQAGGANTNAAFGTITAAAIPSRHAVASIRFTF